MAPRTVADVMRRDVITISPTASVRELASVLHQNHVDGVPVVEGQEDVIGMVSSTDILWQLDRVRETSGISGAELFAQPLLDQLTVRDIMTPDVFSVPSNTTIRELLDFFVRTGVRRAVVVDDGVLSGIVSLSDVLALISR